MRTCWSPARALIGMGILGILLPSAASANVYPSGLKVLDNDLVITACDAAVVRYILNEAADTVQIRVLKAGDGTAVRTVNLTSQAKGVYNFVWDKRDDAKKLVPAGQYKVEITAAAAGYGAWTLISTDSEANNFELPRGVAVNKNPNSEYYGRVYVSNARDLPTGAGRVMGDGIYILNADLSVVAGPLSGGVDWSMGTTSPFRLEVGPDDRLYIADWSDAHSGLWIADPDVTAAAEVLDSSTGRDADGLTETHGSVADVWVTGTGADRKIYTVDEDFGGDVPRYDIGESDLFTGIPSAFFYDDVAAGNININYLSALAFQSDGTLWLSQYRADGTDQASVWQVSADGTTVIFNSLNDLGKPDPLRGTQGIAYDPVNNLLAFVTLLDTGKIIIFDPVAKSIVTTFNFGGGSTNCDVAFDAVGNLYVTNRTTERMRVWSPPTGAHSNTTTSVVFTLSGAGVGGPTITQQPQPTGACPNTNAVFNVAANGVGTLRYRWNRNGEEIPGQAGNGSATLNLPVTLADNGAKISVSICDNNGVTLSEEVILTVFGAPNITAQPAGVGLIAGQSATYTVTAVSQVTFDPTLSYQWKKTLGQTTIDVGTNAPTLEVIKPPITEHGAIYRVDITDACGNVKSSANAVLNIVPKPCNDAWVDADNDGDGDQEDFGAFQACFTGAGNTGGFDAGLCRCFDRDKDLDVDQDDYTAFQACASGPSVPTAPFCGATLLFQDDFDAGTSAANWTLKTTTDDRTVNFAYNYGATGIPPAPRSEGGTTVGLFMSVNDRNDPPATDPLEAAVAYANMAAVSGDVTLRYDMWMNYGGSGTTEFAIAGLNGDGSSIQVPTAGTGTVAGAGPVASGYLLALDGESGTARDARAYEGATDLLGAGGGFGPSNGSQDSAVPPFSTIFPAPRAEFAGGPGNASPTRGWGWARVEISLSGGMLRWKLNDVLVNERAVSAFPSGVPMIGYMDIFASVSSASTYVIYDNVSVSTP